MLCFNGTRDALCERELMEPIVSKPGRWQMHWLEGADHSFHVLKSSGRTDEQVMEEVGTTAQQLAAAASVRKLLVFQHAASEPLGVLDPMLRRWGFRIRYANFARDPGAAARPQPLQRPGGARRSDECRPVRGLSAPC